MSAYAQPVLPMMCFFCIGISGHHLSILPLLQAVSWSHCLEHNTYTNILWDNSKTCGVSEESGECCTLREQTAPELVMDPHCREKQAHLQLRPSNRQRREGTRAGSRPMRAPGAFGALLPPFMPGSYPRSRTTLRNAAH